MNLQSKFQNPNSKIITVLLVDDSPIALTILKRMLSTSPEMQVVGTAGNGKEALELIPQLKPTVICTDLHMPVMDGFELTKRVMAEYPTPILVVSVSVQKDRVHNIFRLLEVGAVDVFPKPRTGLDSDYERLTQELIQKVKVLSGVLVFRKQRKEPVPVRKVQLKTEETSFRIAVIGASTGGPQALQTILTQLPHNFPLPVICIQHISKGFMAGLVDWLIPQCKTKIKIALAGEFPVPGTVYFAPEETHLLVDNKGRFMTSAEPSLNGFCPSITVAMKSVADAYGSKAIGILLSGMGKDGAEGMVAIAQAGGITVVQEEESCVVFGMPNAAIERGAARYVLSPNDIAGMLVHLQNGNPAV